MANTNNTNNKNNVALKASKCCGAKVERILYTVPFNDIIHFRLYTYICSKCQRVIRRRDYIIGKNKLKKEFSRYNIIFR